MKPMKRFFPTLLAAALSASPLFARIGETKNDMQSRMLTKTGGAYAYTSKEERLRETLELPYKHVFLLMPKDAQNFFFFKRADAATSTASDVVQQHDLYGWELHVCFDGANSALETYRRHGEPLSVEELAALFDAQTAGKDGVFWRRSDFTETLKSWRVASPEKTPDGKPKSVADILPQSASRPIFVEIPQDVKNSADYGQSIQAQIMEFEQRNAYDAYRKYVARQSAISAAKTAPSSAGKGKKNVAPAGNSSVRKVNPFDGGTQKYVEIDSESGGETLRTAYLLRDVFYGGSLPQTPTKEVRIQMKIPLRPDTAFGYDFETSDGKLRAKLFKKGVLFVSTKFDSELRKYMESLYESQSAERAESARESTLKF